MIQRLFVASLIVSSAAGAAAAPAFMRPTHVDARELVVNGDFERPAIDANDWDTFDAIPGWFMVYGSGIEVQSGVAGAPYAGAQLVELDAHSASGDCAGRRDHAGGRLRVTLAFAARPGTPPGDNVVEVRFGGRLVETLRGSGLGAADTTWKVSRWRVRATAPTSRIELRDLGDSNGVGSYVDAVSLRQVGG